MLSSETQHSESGLEDLSSLGQDVISAIMGEKYDSVREGLEIEESHRYCGLAQFNEGNDIGRQSFKKSIKNIKMDKEVNGFFLNKMFLKINMFSISRQC